MAVVLLTSGLVHGHGTTDKPDLAGFLVQPAERALAERKFGLAVSLWRGIAAIRGDGDPSLVELARVWTLAGEFDEAIEELDRHRRALTDPTAIATVSRKITELEVRPRGFTGGVFKVTPAEAQAREAFKRGRRELAAGRAAGNYRELGAALGKLRRAGEATALYLRYLRLRPFGRNADELRARLPASALGTLAISSSFACEQVWMNRQPLPRPLPVDSLKVAPGRYRLLCYSEKYHFARYLDVEVPRGGTARAEFTWAIIENRLDPWGRIVMENPDRETEMNDIGVWEEIGVPVPDDRRPLRVLLRAGDSSRRKELSIKLEAGKRFPLVW
jgi:hypothetical protein